MEEDEVRKPSPKRKSVMATDELSAAGYAQGNARRGRRARVTELSGLAAAWTSPGHAARRHPRFIPGAEKEGLALNPAAPARLTTQLSPIWLKRTSGIAKSGLLRKSPVLLSMTCGSSIHAWASRIRVHAVMDGAGRRVASRNRPPATAQQQTRSHSSCSRACGTSGSRTPRAAQTRRKTPRQDGAARESQSSRPAPPRPLRVPGILPAA